MEKIDIIPDNHFYIGVDIDSDGMFAVVTDMKGRVLLNGNAAVGL